MITLKNVKKHYRKKRVYENINGVIQTNGITLLIGANGIGKTTLLKMIAGIENVSSGDILFDGVQTTAKQRQVIMSYVPQEIALWEHLTLEENVQFFLGLIDHPISKEQIEAYVRAFQLDSMMHTKVSQLSGGTQRKGNLLIGLLSNPKILLLDEPTVGIDLASRMNIQHMLTQLQASCTIIMTTHLLDEIEKFDQQLVVIGQDPFYEQLLREKNKSFVQWR